MEIPKVIHYCWFGKSPLPKLAIQCIKSWKKYFPEYEIKEWNEDNYDVHKIPYIKEAYEAKKYAFVSDYARFDILYTYGGVYFDTDVEVIKSFNEIINRGAFMGFERDGSQEKGQEKPKDGKIQRDLGERIAVAPGLGIAATPNMKLYKKILDSYEKIHFKNNDGTNNMKTVVEYVTEILIEHGLKNIEGIQHVAGVTIYPKEYFSPKDVDTKKLIITEKTCSIHHYDASWAEWYDKRAGERGPILKEVFGEVLGGKINSIIYAIQRFGIKECIEKILDKLP